MVDFERIVTTVKILESQVDEHTFAFLKVVSVLVYLEAGCKHMDLLK
jgi:hypothetical protein